jgi:phage baseplate assembly protein W
MPKTFLGVGWGFPMFTPGSNTINRAEYDESVRQSIWIILGTAKGERVMRPDFGCAIHDLVFERSTAATAGKISEAVRDALLSFEPRIELLNVQVEPEDRDSILQISIDYQVRATNNAFNVVFPFYLEQGAAR